MFSQKRKQIANNNKNGKICNAEIHIVTTPFSFLKCFAFLWSLEIKLWKARIPLKDIKLKFRILRTDNSSKRIDRYLGTNFHGNVMH